METDRSSDGSGGVQTYGPITQGELLMGLGMEARLGQLVAAAGGEQTDSAKAAISAAQRLVDSREATSMGRLFKALAITHHPPASDGGDEVGQKFQQLFASLFPSSSAGVAQANSQKSRGGQ